MLRIKPQRNTFITGRGRSQGRSACCPACIVGQPCTNSFARKSVGSGIKDVVNKFVNKNPVELHLIDQPSEGGFPKKSSFTGPGTKHKNRLRDFDPKTATFSEIITPPINDLDKAALSHDMSYVLNKDVETRNIADQILSEEAQKVITDRRSTSIQIANAKFVKAIMDFKVKKGIGLKPLGGGRRIPDFLLEGKVEGGLKRSREQEERSRGKGEGLADLIRSTLGFGMMEEMEGSGFLKKIKKKFNKKIRHITSGIRAVGDLAKGKDPRRALGKFQRGIDAIMFAPFEIQTALPFEKLPIPGVPPIALRAVKLAMEVGPKINIAIRKGVYGIGVGNGMKRGVGGRGAIDGSGLLKIGTHLFRDGTPRKDFSKRR